MMISELGIGFSGQTIVDYDIPDLFHVMGLRTKINVKVRALISQGSGTRAELNCGQRRVYFFWSKRPEQFQCRRGAARRVAVRVKLVFLGVVAAKGIANAAIAPTKAPKMANSTFWFVYESRTPAMLMV